MTDYRANEAIMKKNASQNTRIKEEIAKVKNSMQYMKTQYAVSFKECVYTVLLIKRE